MAVALVTRASKQSMRPDEVCISAMLSALENCSRSSAFVEGLHRIPDSPRIRFRQLILASCICGALLAQGWQASVSSISTMPPSRLALDTIACSSGISACENACRWGVAVAACMHFQARASSALQKVSPMCQLSSRWHQDRCVQVFQI